MSPWVRANGAARHCLLDSLEPSSRTYLPAIGAASTLVALHEEAGAAAGCRGVSLWPLTSAPEGSQHLGLGHQEDEAGEHPCPMLADDAVFGSAASPPSPRLAAVAVAYDERSEAVLLTRRPRAMRTFPGV